MSDEGTELYTFTGALQTVQSGFDTWKINHPKWFRRIDGTPIPNDLCVVIAEAVRDAALREAEARNER